MSIRYGVILSYWLIVSNTSRCNTIIFYSINSNNYIIDTTKLLVEIGKKNLEKIGLLDNQKPEPKFLRKVIIRIRFTILLARNF